MLARLFIWLCRRMTIHAKQYKSGTHVNGYIRYIGSIMVDYTRDTWRRQERAIVKLFISTDADEVNKVHPMRLFTKRAFIWMCMIITRVFGKQWGCSTNNALDYDIKLGAATIGWGKYDNGIAPVESYAEISMTQYADIVSNCRRRYIRKPFIRKPFKRGSAYEWQIGPCVFMLYYPHSTFVPDRDKWETGFFWDEYWSGVYTPNPLIKPVVWLSKKGEQSYDEGNYDETQYTWKFGPLTIKSWFDVRLNFYTISWNGRDIWHDAN